MWKVRPPRQIDDSISRELDRICLRALARRRSERYSTALDFAEELNAFVEESRNREQASQQRATFAPPPSSAKPTNSDSDPTSPGAKTENPNVGVGSGSGSSESPAIRIVPKGLRSFDASDAEFFLELIPGPRDRHGLPDAIRFWKHKLEQTNSDKTFPVGLLYGPSGCGKSSLVKAGLLPRLAKHVVAFYFEASGEDCETNILGTLKRHYPSLDPCDTLSDALASLRRDLLTDGQKLVLIIDQFEQWLNSWNGGDLPSHTGSASVRWRSRPSDCRRA